MEKLLFEIGTEEIPANFMSGILAQLKELTEKKLNAARIPFESVKVYGTPRRLTFIAEGVAPTQADSVVEAKGPSAKIAFVQGSPSKAAIGFARGQGVDVNDLEVRGEYVYAVKHLAGKEVKPLLPELLMDILTSLNFPKNMRWADYEFRFVRPIRWLVALFGEEVIPVEITGVQSSKFSRGHRFLKRSAMAEIEEAAKKEEGGFFGVLKSAAASIATSVKNDVASAVAGTDNLVEIENPDVYVKTLMDNFVMVEQDARKELIRKQVTDLAIAEGGHAEINEDLLEEVNYLVEWPTALCGKFEDKFLRLPKECIITPMREHQRYFPVMAEDGSLLNKFITIRNGNTDHLEVVAHGNERVLRARLSDAEFFFDEDRKQKLSDRLEKLKTVSFQEGLGNMYNKSQRLIGCSKAVAYAINKNVDEDKLARAAELAKCDLVTGMVVEFTELQGVMGREYALLDGEPKEVATGIYEHYLPRFAGDALPKTDIGRIISIVDKIDNICATFSRGMAPTGSQDPYALRRQTLGIINILIDANYHLDLAKIIAAALVGLSVPTEKIHGLMDQICEFIGQRLKNMLMDQGVRYDVVEAVLADIRVIDIADLYARANALNAFMKTPSAASFVQAASRVANLTKKIEVETAITPSLFETDAEKELHAAVLAVSKEIIVSTTWYDYNATLLEATKLIAPINKFFEDVMVMVEDERVKNNRLALLSAVKDCTHAVGDINLIVEK